MMNLSRILALMISTLLFCGMVFTQPIVDTLSNNIDGEAVENVSNDDLNAWISAYKSYLSNKSYLNLKNDTDAKFSLIRLSNSNTPQLCISFGSYHAAGVYILTYKDGNVVQIKENYQFGEYGIVNYNPDDNLIVSSYTQDGVVSGFSFKIKDNELVTESEFYNNEASIGENYTSTINGENVTTEQFFEHYNQLYEHCYYTLDYIYMKDITTENIDVIDSWYANAQGQCGDNANYTYDGKNLVISGTGATYDYYLGLNDISISEPPWNHCNYDYNSVGYGRYMYYIENVTVEEGITRLGDCIFEFAELSKITLPKTLQTIGKYAFFDCMKLTEITLPVNIQSIDDYAFMEASNLTTITVLNPNMQFGDESIGYNFNPEEDYLYSDNITIRGYRNSTAQAYAEANGINFEILNNQCGDTAYWEYSDGTLAIYGTGNMYGYNSENLEVPWEEYVSSINRIVIQDGITGIDIPTSTLGLSTETGPWAEYNYSSHSNSSSSTSTTTQNNVWENYYDSNEIEYGIATAGGTITDTDTYGPWTEYNYSSHSSSDTTQNNPFEKYYDADALHDGITGIDSTRSSFVIIVPKSVISISLSKIETSNSTIYIIYGFTATEAELYCENNDRYNFKSLNGILDLSVSCDDSYNILSNDYTINVTITIANWSSYNLNNVTLKLNLPDGVTCTYLSVNNCFPTNFGGQALGSLNGLSLMNFEATLELSYNIILSSDIINFSVEASADDQPNVDPNTSDVISTIQTETVTVEKAIMKKNGYEDNTLSKEDVFRFTNIYWDFFEIFGDNDGDKCHRISDEAFNRLTNGMDNVVTEHIREQSKVTWNGSCDGMSRVVSLVKGNYINVGNFSNGKSRCTSLSELKDPKNDSDVQDLVNFYFLSKYLPYCQNQYSRDIKYIDNTTYRITRLKKIVTETQKVENGGLPVCLSYFTSSEAHTIVAYACEPIDVNHNVVSVNSEAFHEYRISIYDCSRSKNFKTMYMYIGKDYDYCYYDVTYVDDNKTTIGFLDQIGKISASPEELNLVDFETGAKSSLCTTSYEHNFLISYASSGIYLTADNRQTILSTIGVGDGDIYTYTFPESGVALDEDGNAIPISSYTTYFDDDFNDEDITLTLETTGQCDFSMIYTNCMVSAEGSNLSQVDMKSTGEVEIQAEGSDYELSLTFNEGYYTLPWHTITVSGTNSNEASLSKTDEGIILNGDNLSDVKVYANSSDESVELNFSSDTDNVLIASTNSGDLAIYSDTNGDGSYEQLLTNASVGTSSFTNFKVIMIAVIIVVVVLVIVLIMVIKTHKRRF